MDLPARLPSVQPRPFYNAVLVDSQATIHFTSSLRGKMFERPCALRSHRRPEVRKCGREAGEHATLSKTAVFCYAEPRGGAKCRTIACAEAANGIRPYDAGRYPEKLA
jgi:hypothetical protein